MRDDDGVNNSTRQDAPLAGFSHVQLQVSDVAASEQWYSTVLGLERFASSDSGDYVALRHKASRVVIVLSRREAEPSGHASDSLDHLALAVPDRAALEAWANHLIELGIEHPGVVLELGKPSLQLRDPDGISIELVAPAPRS